MHRPNTEIERKFLVLGEEWRGLSNGVYIRQGYLCYDETSTVRIRQFGDEGFLTVKGRTIGITRTEYEYKIPIDEAEYMLTNLCQKPLIEKHRYHVPFGGLVWEVDEFHGSNQGLVIAEIELISEDQKIHKPVWVGLEVSLDSRYTNSNLAKTPYQTWS
ncbi:adenylate cyclase [Candidatus Poribacteria bacterium]|nr:adenylate cyclase [Candidatus Poribacteria bacterium]